MMRIVLYCIKIENSELVGKTRRTLKECFKMYNYYSIQVGFDVRYSKTMYNVKVELLGREFY